MQGTAGDLGDADAKDPIDKTSSRVQAVACFFPPTDFLNYGKAGENALGPGRSQRLQAAVRFSGTGSRTPRSSGRSPTRPRSWRSAAQISPVNHVIAGRSADAHHPRRRRLPRADPAGRAHRREAEEGRRREQACRQERGRARLARPAEGHDDHRRLVRRAPQEEAQTAIEPRPAGTRSSKTAHPRLASRLRTQRSTRSTRRSARSSPGSSVSGRCPARTRCTVCRPAHQGLQVVGDRQVGAVGPSGGLGLIEEIGDRGPREKFESDEIDDGAQSRTKRITLGVRWHSRRGYRRPS